MYYNRNIPTLIFTGSCTKVFVDLLSIVFVYINTHQMIILPFYWSPSFPFVWQDRDSKYSLPGTCSWCWPNSFKAGSFCPCYHSCFTFSCSVSTGLWFNVISILPRVCDIFWFNNFLEHKHLFSLTSIVQIQSCYLLLSWSFHIHIIKIYSFGYHVYISFHCHMIWIRIIWESFSIFKFWATKVKRLSVEDF